MGFKYLPGRPLIVVNESDSNLRDLIAQVLKDRGYKVAVGDDGPKAVQLSLSLLPDLIIMNVMMPRMHAGMVFKSLKEDPRTSSIKVIVMSNKKSVQELCPGADGFVPKPFEIKELLDLVEKLVGVPAEE